MDATLRWEWQSKTNLKLKVSKKLGVSRSLYLAGKYSHKKVQMPFLTFDAVAMTTWGKYIYSL
jgi:hypothetical protein